MERGLSKTEMHKMTIGEIVDFVEEHNERMKRAEREEEHKKSVKKYRLATPEEVSAYHRS